MSSARKAALDAGQRTYFTGAPCIRGHLSERLTLRRTCLACVAEYKAELYERQKTQIHARRREAYAIDSSKVLAQCASYRDRNRAKRSAYTRDYCARNREERAAYLRDYKQRNAAKIAALNAAHEARKRQRVPPWADFQSIEAIYGEARRLTQATGVVHHVDHDIPLCGELVSGLHVETNLKVLTAAENLLKSNKFDPSRYEWRKEKA